MGFLGDLFGSGEKKLLKESLALQKDMLRKYEDLRVPTIEELQYDLPTYAYLGDYSPEMRRLFEMGPSAYEGISIDPATAEAQMQALGGMGEIVEGGGMDAQLEADLFNIAREQEAQARGAREAALQGMQERGMLSSGMTLASQQMANQQAAMRAAQRGMDSAAMADERYRAALASLGALGGQIRGQEFGEQEAVARARDLINQFNVQQRTSAEAANVAARNEAALRNLAEQQRIAEQNVGQREKEAIQRVDAQQLKYGMEADKLAGMAGQAGNVSSAMAQLGAARTRSATDAMKMGASLAGSFTGIGAMGNAAGAAMNATQGSAPMGTAFQWSDVRMKENIEPLSDADANDILGSLTGYKYDYKNGPEDQYGVMAQDMESSAAGSKYVDEMENGMKGISYDPSLITALLANLSKRVEDIENG